MTEITSSAAAFESLKSLINPFAEELWVIALNPQLQVIATEMIFRGTADHCPTHPRDIFRFLIIKNASFFMMAHNHPSASVQPSEQDLITTRKMHTCGRIFQIPLIDHIIFSDADYYSMADNGFFKTLKKSARLNY
ncbi:JAB domain-containing protein [Bdellovibrio sp. SKB1291214]|uniref:JAB domain-containing protein n=1 Tax=Bdellovibrio sp. SKB1291214 TaxID=1732569 RepID=UPI0020CD7022|nr:JAB domain-containing protein [Bdellovibrio sp. SKB1291214]UYL10376.1 JAB domain-containing protein [Bdellovibrio sp. SKB1291214]